VRSQGKALAKLLIEDKEEATSVPFLRGILTRSLQQAGLSFQQAYAVADDVREELGDERTLSKLELHRIVYKNLKNQFGSSAADRYLRPSGIVPPVQVADLEGRLSPFSGELHRRDLELIGLSLAESLKVAGKLRRHLFREKLTQVSSQYIARVTYQLLQEMPSLGPAVAQRWLVWREFLRSGRPLILVIGGTTGCGKSTIATALADQLGIVRMQSTDLLREVMRTLLSSDQYPELYTSSYDAWRHLLRDDKNAPLLTVAQGVEEGYRAQAKLVSVASRAVIERALRERESLIIEGVHAYPELASGITDGDPVIVHVMLAVLKRRKLKQRISGRATKAVKRRAERYLAHFDEIWQLQSYLLSEADRTNTPIIINDDRDTTVREIMRTLLDILSTRIQPDAQSVFTEPG
jgi:2-phosphoglycerate kinase